MADRNTITSTPKTFPNSWKKCSSVTLWSPEMEKSIRSWRMMSPWLMKGWRWLSGFHIGQGTLLISFTRSAVRLLNVDSSHEIVLSVVFWCSAAAICLCFYFLIFIYVCKYWYWLNQSNQGSIQNQCCILVLHSQHHTLHIFKIFYLPYFLIFLKLNWWYH